MKRALPAVLGLAAFAAMTAAAFDPAVQLFYRDTGLLYYPVKKFIAGELRLGRLPLWDPWTEGGVSLLGQMSPGLFHPFTLLYLPLPFDLAFKLNHLLPLLVAGLGAFLLARRLGASTWAAMCGAVVYGGCGYLVTQAASNLIFAVGPCTVPLAVERLFALRETPSAKGLLLASLLLALSGLGGEPQSMLMGGLIGAGGILGGALAAAREARPRALVRAVAILSAWAVLALLLAAPAALPALHQLRRSQRAQGLQPWEKGRFFVPVARWPGLFVAGAFDDAPEVTATSLAETRERTPFSEYFAGGDPSAFASSIYLGTPALLLAAFALLVRRGRALWLGSLVLLLAAGGEALGVYPLLSRTVPGFGIFRYAEKMAAPLSLLLALACALGADEAFRSRRRTVALAILSGATALSLAAAAVTLPAWSALLAPGMIGAGTVHDPTAPQRFFAALAPALRTEAVLAAALFLTAAAALLRPGFGVATRPLAAVIGAVAVLLGNAPNLPTIPVEHFHSSPATAVEMERRAGPSAGRFRLYAQAADTVAWVRADPKVVLALHARESLVGQLPSVYGIEAANYYFSAGDALYETVLVRATVPALELLATRFVLLQRIEITSAAAAAAGFERVHFGLWLRDGRRNPERTRLFDAARIVSGPDALIDELRTLGRDVGRTALLLPEAAAYASWPAAGARGRALLARPRPGTIEVKAVSSGRTLLSVSEHYDPGWRASIDGATAPVLPIDGILLGVPLESGSQGVRLWFWPLGLTTGLFAAAAGLVMTLLVGGLTSRVTTAKPYPVKTLRKLCLPMARRLL